MHGGDPQLHAAEIYKPDVVLFDVLGDVVCSGFAMPIRGGCAQEVVIVTSGEMMSLYAADNISRAVRSMGQRGYAKLRGLILNGKGIADERELEEKAAREMETDILHMLPRCPDVQAAEALGATVIEALPDSSMAREYRILAQKLLRNDTALHAV